MTFCLLVCQMCEKGTFSQIQSHIKLGECMEISENQCLHLLYTDACMVVNQQFKNRNLHGAYTNTISMFSHPYRIRYLMASKVLRNLKAIYLADSYCMK